MRTPYAAYPHHTSQSNELPIEARVLLDHLYESVDCPTPPPAFVIHSARCLVGTRQSEDLQTWSAVLNISTDGWLEWIDDHWRVVQRDPADDFRWRVFYEGPTYVG